jgi:5'-nucleotidase
MNRRDFVLNSGKAGLLLAATGIPWSNSLAREDDFGHLTILHTNDTHSRIDPFPSDHPRYSDAGGVLNRLKLLRKIRSEVKHHLLLDAGDIFQGTPYFNLFKGEIEMKSMTALGYDAATIGNHDFDAGVDGLARQLKYAQFPMLNCNYRFQDTPLEGKTKVYQIFERDGLRIGVTGVGIELEGLVGPEFTRGVKVESPVEHVNRVAGQLKRDYDCHLVVVLSHLGYAYRSEKISDTRLARMTENVDLIIGGHTHTFLEKPVVLKNRTGAPVLIHQVGWGGLVLGRIDLSFERNSKKLCYYCQNEYVTLPSY